MVGNEVFIVGAVRTPVGRGSREKGIYGSIHPAELLGGTYVGLLERTAVDPAQVDGLVIGCVYQMAEQSSGIARTAWLAEGLPEQVAGTTVDIRCGSGQQAVNVAATRVAAGVEEVVLAGGIEHMGRVGFPVNLEVQERYGGPFPASLLEHYAIVPQGESAELIADRWGIGREEMDALALRSHRLADAAAAAGRFDREMLPVAVGDAIHTTDQGVRPDTSAEALAGLRPAFREDGRVTAGNSSQISDGAAALLLCSERSAAELGLMPRARIDDQLLIGVDPVTMLTGPIPATREILSRNGLEIGDLDAIEINEAFASVVLAWQRELEPDMDRVNRRGGAIAIGHPLGASGARLLTTLLHTLEDEDGELGLVTMCCAGGLGTATLIQRL